MDKAAGKPPPHRVGDTPIELTYASSSPPSPPPLPTANSDPEVAEPEPEPERQSRKELGAEYHRDVHGRTKMEHTTTNQSRYLSPSPAPSFRSSSEPYTYPGPPLSREPSSHQPRPSVLRRFWARNQGPCLVALSQFFGALMNLSARLLEFEGHGMHPVQVLLLRQALTSLCCFTYMWWMKTPGAPFGGWEIRILLFIRGISGFFGIFGMWYSMMYLPLADATVITFLAPGIAGLVCYFLLKEPFTRLEQFATMVALMGVILIAQPSALFHKSSEDVDDSPGQAPEGGGSHLPDLDHEATSEERLVAVGVALLGVCGAAGAFTTLRMIGKRAHPLISVNFFAVTSTVICICVLIAAPLLDISQPALRWTWPASAKGWVLLLTLGVLGFTMQYLLTSGLAADKSNRANAMVYTHMLFAVSFDRWVFHHQMNLMSFGGCALILGSAVGVIMLRKPPVPKPDDVERQHNIIGDGERSPMLVGVGGNTDELPLEQLRLR